MICITCSIEHNEKFCPNCGEKSGIKKITFSSIIEDTFSTVTNMDRGFLYNLKTLAINPRKICIDYIRGKRKGVLNPISYLIISITIYLIIERFFKLSKGEMDSSASLQFSKKGYDIGYAGGKIISTYFKYFWIFSTVLLANSTKLIFGKYNYLEHIAISSFIIGQATLIGVIGFFAIRLPLVFNPIIYLAIFLLIYFVFQQGKNKSESLILSFTGLILFIIQIFIVVLVLGLAMIE